MSPMSYLLPPNCHMMIKLVRDSPVEHAVYYIRLLIEKCHQRDLYSGSRILHAAIKRNSYILIRCLVTYGVDVSEVDDWGQTPLFRFIAIDMEDKQMAILRELIPTPIHLNHVDVYGDTALTLAIRLHQNNIVQKLLSEHNCPVTRITDSQEHPFILYCSEGTLENDTFTSFITRGVDINLINKEKRTVLHCVLINNGVDPGGRLLNRMVDILVKKGADLGVQDIRGDTPLMLAIRRGLAIDTILKLIPSSRERLNAIDDSGYNALALTLINRDIETDLWPDTLVEELLKKGIESRSQSFWGETVLSLARTNFSVSTSTVLRLLDSGVEIRCLDIIECITSFRLDILELYLENGKNIGLANAVPGLLLYLVQHIPGFGYYYRPVPLYSIPRRIKLIAAKNQKLLLTLIRKMVNEFGFDVNFVGNSTLLHALVEANEFFNVIPCIDYLLSLKYISIDAQVKGCGDGTALNHAIRRGEYKLAERLIANYADIQKIDLDKDTLKPGFFKTFVRLYETGLRFPPEFTQSISDLQKNNQNDISNNVDNKRSMSCADEEEIHKFAEWLANSAREVRSLRSMALMTVRKVFKNRTKEMVNDCELHTSWEKDEVSLPSLF